MIYKIGIIKIDFKPIVKEMLRKDCRKEALEIINHCIKNAKDSLEYKLELAELYLYYKEDMGNIFCLHLDKLKSNLVKEGKMEKSNCFGMEIFD
jgi:hypothetical protein